MVFSINWGMCKPMCAALQ